MSWLDGIIDLMVYWLHHILSWKCYNSFQQAPTLLNTEVVASCDRHPWA